MTRLLRQFNDSVEDKHPLSELERIVAEINEVADAVEFAHEHYIECMDDAGENQDAGELEAWIEEVRARTRVVRNTLVTMRKDGGSSRGARASFQGELDTYLRGLENLKARCQDETSADVLANQRSVVNDSLGRVVAAYAELCSLDLAVAADEQTMAGARRKAQEVDVELAVTLGKLGRSVSGQVVGGGGQSSSRVKLEAIKLPDFSGGKSGYSEWPTFLATWRRIAETHWPKDLLDQVLLSHLKGEAASVVEACSHDYDEMMKLLSEMYGDERSVQRR